MKLPGKTTLRIVVFMSLFFFAVAGAAAQNQDLEKANQSAQDQTTDPEQSTNRKPALYRAGHDLLGDGILGMAVKTGDGEEVGEIEDVTFGRNGKIERFIIDTGGGFLGMGGKTVSIHRNDLSYEADKEYAVYRGTKQDLENMPDINYNWYAYGNRGYRYGNGDRYWGPSYADPQERGNYGDPFGYGPAGQRPGADGSRPMRQQSRQGREGQAENGQMSRGDQDSQSRMAGEGVRGYYSQQQSNMSDLSLNNIIGAQVRTQSGDTVGEIENLVVDPRGRIRSAVIDVGGFLGIGSKTVAVPFSRLRNLGPHYVIYPGTEEELRGMPEFSGDL